MNRDRAESNVLALPQAQETLTYMRKALINHETREYSILAVFGKESREWEEYCRLHRAAFRAMCAAADLVTALGGSL